MKERNDKKEEKIGAPGSLAMAIVFLLFFIMMYAINYKLLSETWGVR